MAQENVAVQEREFKAIHQVVRFATSFAKFTQNLEQTLGSISASDLATAKSGGISALTRRLSELLKGEELIIFQIFDHGSLLATLGQKGDVKQYLIGNPLTALSMTKHNRGAALYAPLRVLVAATESGGTQVEYDLPSSLFGQFESPDVLKVARELDAKLINVLSRSAALN